MNNKNSLLPHSIKGYNLYSLNENGPQFILITGTSRSKTFEEIISSDDIIEADWVKIAVTGIDEIRSTLSRLPTREHIFWDQFLQDHDLGIIFFSNTCTQI
jgi:hypothetical protein